jgi:hypothetical protein
MLWENASLWSQEEAHSTPPPRIYFACKIDPSRPPHFKNSFCAKPIYMGEIYKSNVKSTTLENEASLLKRKFWYSKKGTCLFLQLTTKIYFPSFKIFHSEINSTCQISHNYNYIQHHSSARKPTEVKKIKHISKVNDEPSSHEHFNLLEKRRFTIYFCKINAELIFN